MTSLMLMDLLGFTTCWTFGGDPGFELAWKLDSLLLRVSLLIKYYYLKIFKQLFLEHLVDGDAFLTLS